MRIFIQLKFPAGWQSRPSAISNIWTEFGKFPHRTRLYSVIKARLTAGLVFLTFEENFRRIENGSVENFDRRDGKVLQLPTQRANVISWRLSNPYIYVCMYVCECQNVTLLGDNAGINSRSDVHEPLSNALFYSGLNKINTLSPYATIDD